VTSSTNKMNSNQKGNMVEGKAIAYYTSLGYQVFTSIGDGDVDLVYINDKGKAIRVQCKHGNYIKTNITFNVYCSGPNMKTKTYHGKVDEFFVYCLINKKSYIVPIKKVGTGKFTMRTVAVANNQKKKINWAKDYQVAEEGGLAAHGC